MVADRRKHRRLRLADVLAFKHQRDIDLRAAFDEMSEGRMSLSAVLSLCGPDTPMTCAPLIASGP
jgi:hypothetical protein